MDSKYRLEKPKDLIEILYSRLLDQDGNMPDVTEIRNYNAILEMAPQSEKQH